MSENTNEKQNETTEVKTTTKVKNFLINNKEVIFGYCAGVLTATLVYRAVFREPDFETDEDETIFEDVPFED